MTKLEKQILFGRLFRILELYAEAMGYVLVTGMHWRSPEESQRLEAAGRGISPSLHEHCLAAHIEARKDGEYLQYTEQLRELGEFWERLHPLCRWGGRFDDGCHFSLEHGAMR